MILSSRIPIFPRYAETDQSGFVAEASYVAWLEIGRAALLKAHGFDYRRFEALGYWMPVLEVGFTFQAPAFYDDALTLTTALRSRPSFRIRLDYEIHRGAELLATAYSVQAFVNRSLRPVRPPPDFLAALDRVFPREPANLPADQNSTAGP